MTRKTALQLLLAMPVSYYAAKNARAAESTLTATSDLTLSSIKFHPMTFTFNSDAIAGIELHKGSEKITITFDEIWEALKADKK